ncbi:MAG: DMT family transporter [Elusimicrobia bacterium]|nr:DMT family transporter [Elusimicrobiota bacterium]
MDILLFCLLAAFWGGSFVAIKFAVLVFPPAFSAMLRVGLAVAVLGALFRYEKRNLRVPFATRHRMWLAGLFAQGLPFALLFWGEKKISPGLAGIINGTVPIWAFVLGLLGGSGETFTARKTAGLLLGFGGIAVICSPMLTFAGTRAELAGTAAVFLMAISYGVGTLLTRSLLSGGAKADFRANIFHQHCASLAFLFAVSALAEPWPSWGAVLAAPAAAVSIIYLGVFSTAIAFMIYFHLIREWGAVRASAVTYVAPIVAVFWDYVFFRNVPDRFEIVGVLAVLSGVVLLHSPSPKTVVPPDGA